jgi:NADH:ubiquinone oxidoreductase subunit F (NADH-binding)
MDDYIARDGYRAIAKVLSSMSPDDVIEEVVRSGLRGRGGAGFSTGTKWRFARNSKGDMKYIICNADEGDPGAFMDRAVLEGDPHTVIECSSPRMQSVRGRDIYTSGPSTPSRSLM